MKSVLDFLVIGAAKSGTTSLFEYLRHHPRIYLPPGKENPFFSHERYRLEDWSEYLRKGFAGSPDALWGTVTPQYMAGCLIRERIYTGSGSSGTGPRAIPRRIYAVLPTARLIAILRDPVTRFVSDYRMETLRGRESRTLTEVVEDVLRPEVVEFARHNYTSRTKCLSYGEYGRILGGYLDVFPPDQLLVLFTDDLQRDPAEVVRQILMHIGLPPTFEPPNLGTRYLAGGDRLRTRFDLGHLQTTVSRNPALRAGWHALPRPIRWRLDRGYRALQLRHLNWNRRTDPVSLEPPPEVVKRLRAHFDPDSRQLAKLLGRPLPWMPETRSGTRGEVERGTARPEQ
jgi:hypothetical protein